MNEFQIVHLVALAGCLVLVGSGLAAHRLSLRRGVQMALIWLGIFVGVTLFIDLVR